MPGRATTKRAAAVLLAIAVTMLATGCASTDHSWRGEFDARLEEASASIEAGRKVLDPVMGEGKMIQTSKGPAQELALKSELIAKLDAPTGCKAVNEKGSKQVFATAEFIAELPKNMTPYLHSHLPGTWKEVIARFARTEREAETCE